MARYIDNTLPYFPLYCDFFTNKKYKFKSMRVKFGGDGVFFWLYTQCYLFDNDGYYIDLNKDIDFIEDTAGELGISENLIRQVMKFLCERSMIDSKLFTSDNVITSKEIQLTYQNGIKGRNLNRNVEVDKKLWLLDEKETLGCIKVRSFLETSETKGVNPEKMSVNSENITQCNVGKSNAMEGKVSAAAPPPSQTIDRNFLIEKFGIENVADYENRFERWRQKKHGVNISMYETIYKWLQQDGVQKPVNKSSFDMDAVMKKIIDRHKEV